MPPPRPDRALVVGRFQPFHNGHLHVVKTLSSEFEKVFLGVGSAQASHTGENPFTAGERLEMIHRALDGARITNAVAIPLFDMFRNAVWVSHVVSQVPPFRVFVSNNPLPVHLFREAGYDVRGFPFVEQERFSGRHIRRLMAEGGDWQGLVPAEVVKYLESIRGAERLREVLHGEGPGEGHA